MVEPLMTTAIKKLHLSAQKRKDADFDPPWNQTDVIVTLQSGHTYVASAFTYEEILRLQQLHQQNGQYLQGRYFWVRQLLLVKDCTEANLRDVVNHLLEEGDFEQVFMKIS